MQMLEIREDSFKIGKIRCLMRSKMKENKKTKFKLKNKLKDIYLHIWEEQEAVWTLLEDRLKWDQIFSKEIIHGL